MNIKKMCEISRVSRSGYYRYIQSRSNKADEELQDELDFKLIQVAYDYKSWKKGAVQIKMRIERDYGIIMNLKIPYEVDQYLTDKTLVKYLSVIVPQSINHLFIVKADDFYSPASYLFFVSLISGIV